MHYHANFETWHGKNKSANNQWCAIMQAEEIQFIVKLIVYKSA